MIITINETTPLLNRWQRMHWTQRQSECARWAQLIWCAHRPPSTPVDRCIITVERHSIKLADWDGMYGGLKPVLDALVVRSKTNPHGLGFIVDDNPFVVVNLVGKQVKASRRKEQKTIIKIDPIE